MADQIPVTLSNSSIYHARGFAGSTLTLTIISTILFGARLYVRARPVLRFGWDDYLIIIAYVLMIIDWALLLSAVDWVFDSSTTTITLAHVERSFKFSIIAQPLWAWAMVFIKNSIAFMLLRVQRTTSWKRFLYGLVTLHVVMGVFNTIFQLTQCIPLSSTWTLLDPPEAKCWSARAGQISAITVSVINCLTDVIFALIPITFLRKIRRPLIERIVVGLLMSLGLLAAGASIAKAVIVENMKYMQDSSSAGIAIGLCSCLEEQLGFIAACMPCLKTLFHDIFLRLGLLPSHSEHTSWAGEGSYGEISGDYHTSTTISAGPSTQAGSRSRSRSRSRRKKKNDSDTVNLKDLPSLPSSSNEDLTALPQKLYKSETGRIMMTREVRMEEEADEVMRDKRQVTSNTLWDPASDRYITKRTPVEASSP